MQQIISKFKKDSQYFRVLNVIGGNVVHFNIYKKINNRLKEMIPDMFEESFVKELFNNDNYISVTQEEIEFFNKALSWNKKYKLQRVNEYIKEILKNECEVIDVESYSGINYAVLKYPHKHYNEVVGILLDENCNVTKTYDLSNKLFEMIITDFATKSNTAKSQFVQYSHYILWGIKRKGKSIIVSQFSIGVSNLICEKAFAIHIEPNNKYRLYDHTENKDSKVFNIIEEVVKEMISDFMECILIENLNKV